MNEIKLVATDLDGTLLNSDKMVSDYNRMAIQKMCQQGVIFGIVSGRPVETIQKMIPKWQLEDEVQFIVGMNGGAIYDVENDEKESFYMLDEEAITSIMDHFQGYDVIFHIKIGTKRYTNYSTEFTRKDALRYGEEEIEADLYELMKGRKVGKINVNCEPEKMDETLKKADEYVNENVIHFKTQPTIIEFVDHHVNKGLGLEKIANHFQIPIENTAAFGDAANDLALLKKAGTSICMQNGDVRVKEISDIVTELNNDQDAVGHFIMEHIVKED